MRFPNLGLGARVQIGRVVRHILAVQPDDRFVGDRPKTADTARVDVNDVLQLTPASARTISIFECLTLAYACAGTARRAAASSNALADRVSAVSQGIRRLEDGIGMALVTRTTRSVRLTEAGESLFAALSQPMSDITEALEHLAAEDQPRGLLRLAVTSIAEEFLSGPLLAQYAEANPAVTIDVTVTDEEFDIVAAGFDAGVRLGEVIEQDMIAVPIGGQQREAAVAAPSYLATHGAPSHPRDLVHHRCIAHHQLGNHTDEGNLGCGGRGR